MFVIIKFPSQNIPINPQKKILTHLCPFAIIPQSTPQAQGKLLFCLFLLTPCVCLESSYNTWPFEVHDIMCFS